MGDAAAVAERYYEGLEARDAGRATSPLAPGCPVHVPGATLDGPEQAKAWMQGFFDAFPDITHQHDDLREDGERVITRVHISGTHTAPLAFPDGELAPSGRRVHFEAENEIFVRDGAITELRIAFDPGELIRQLGAG